MEKFGKMLRRLLAMLLVVFALSLQGCVSPVSGLKSYVDSIDGYKFLYPNGWLPIKVSSSSGADVVFHDIIEQSENVSVVINPVSSGKQLSDLGSPGEVGYQLGKSAIAPPDSGREAELVNAESREYGDKTYYTLEYAVKVNGKERHNLTSAVVSRGKLYTFNASTSEDRWERMQDLLKKVVDSFSVY
jgi:photosystem II oxygen-evolving enhancer protein 2